MLDENGLSIDLEKTTYRENAVQFVTAHSAKGLEFKHVYLIGCTTDKWEKPKGGNFNFSYPDTLTFSGAENKLEGLRRLFYVACTRAEEYLTISYSITDNAEKGKLQSQFVAETGIEAEEKIVDNETLLLLKQLALSKTRQPEIQLGEKELLKQKTEHFKLSASALNTYLDCPIRFYFEKIISIPFVTNDSLAYGNAAHYALEKLFQNLIKHKQFKSKAEFIGDFEAYVLTHQNAFTEKQLQLRLESGRMLLGNYYDQNIDSFNKHVKVEYRVNQTEFAGVPLTGKIDKIEFLNAHSINVVDYKSGNPKHVKDNMKRPDDKMQNGGDYWRQLVFYKILIEADKREDWKVVSGEIDFLEPEIKGQPLEKKKIEITNEDVQIVSHQIIETYNQIKQLQFSKGCGDLECNWCNFVKQNGIEIPVN